ncbi:MAG TPA: hypothetical protein VJT67_09825, partial [Longimicrobiaceae bacterium]|nr:hypothetical protein [Longimicrobiaceae bacterium]
MRRAHAVVAVLTLSMLALPSCKGDQQAGVGGSEVSDSSLPDTLCADPAKWNQLCSTIPHEVMVTLGGDYHGLAPATQTRFDAFSWQSFVALNWPADSAGNPLPGSFTDNPAAPRVWEGWTNAAVLFWGNGATAPCATQLRSGGPGARRVLMQMAKNGQIVNPHADFDEAVGGPLLDRNLNFAVFEKMISPDEVQYLRDSSLVTVAGQEAIDTVNFPPGLYADKKLMTGGRVGSMEVKAAWRILTPQDDSTHFYHQQALIAVPAENSSTGQAFCIQATIGLVGLHIIHKTQDFPAWVWSTFEQEDNAPTCTGSGSCGDANVKYSFYNAACTTCQVNTPLRDSAFLADSSFKWNTSPPYGSAYAVNGQYGSQITRTQPVYVPTDSMNAMWRAKFGNSVWRHYRLIGSQWQAIMPGFPKSDTSEAPPILGNSALESFIPDQSNCIGCHTFATTAGTPAKFADFSFLLGMAGQR